MTQRHSLQDRQDFNQIPIKIDVEPTPKHTTK